MASTYTPIATATATGSSQVITFSSIPATYTDLVIVYSMRSTTSGTQDAVRLQITSTSGIYSDTYLEGDGSAATSARETSGGGSLYGVYLGRCTAAGSTASVFDAGICNIQNYANTTTYKTVLARTSDATNKVTASVGTILSTSAISSLSIFTASANMAAGSTATLYGIKAA